MLRAFSFFAAMATALPAPALAADIVDGGQLIPPGVIWDLNIADDGEGVLPNGLRVGETNVRRLRVTPGGVVGINDVPNGDPLDLARAGGTFIAPFWSRLQVGPCPDGQPAGERRWAETPDGVRFVWLDVPLAGCPAGERASFTVELTADADAQLRRIEYRYAALPDSPDIEPRAGWVSPTVGDDGLEFFPDGARPVRGRAKLLLSNSSDGEDGAWLIELDAHGGLVGDADRDGVRGIDNCPLDPNPRQFDIDGDEDGDACDDDIDNDRVSEDDDDNCPLTVNPGQRDRDGDGLGDRCDDSDGDRVVDVIDRCPDRPDAAQLDLDRDGQPDACDDDIDGDRHRWGGGLWNPLPQPDLCPYIWQWFQTDRDKDGLGDPCDIRPDIACHGFGCLFQADADGDGIPNIFDACPTAADADQFDGDGDGLGDACDPDLDGDGIPDVYAREGLRCDPGVCPR